MCKLSILLPLLALPLFPQATQVPAASGGGTVTAGTGILVAGSQVSIDTAVTQKLSVGQSGSPLYCASASGSATTYTCALTPTLTAYTAGMTLAWKVDTSCTGGTATTLNVDTLGAKSIKQSNGTTDPSSGDCPANQQVTLRYDGTLFRIVGGGATVSFTSGKGYIAVVPNADPSTNGPAYSSKVPRYFQFVVPPGVSTPATKLVFFVSTAATAGACAGAADCGHAAALYDSSCNKISGSDFATNTTAIKSTSIVTQTAATPVTLTGGVYYLGVASDSTALKITSDNGNSSLSYILNASTDTRFATGANSATGDGSTLAMPSSCGALTATNGTNVPVFFIVP